MFSRAPISVVITVYNDWQYLEQAIQSVFEQKLLPSEIIVVDDGSDQSDAQAIIERYVNNQSSVTVIFYRKENGGASSARNYGIQKSREPYIAFLDVDDRMLPNNLYEKFNLISNLDNDYFGVYGGAVRSTCEIEKFPSFDGIADPNLLDKQKQGIPGGSPFFLFIKEALIEINGFDEKLKCNEDYDLLIRLIRKGKRVKGSALPGFYRNIRKNSLSRPDDTKELFFRIMYFLDKAERNNYYTFNHLNKCRMKAHMPYVKKMLINKEYNQAFRLARKAFNYSNPTSVKEVLIYLLSFSFFKC